VSRNGVGWQAALTVSGFRGELRPEAPLAPLTTWRIGGPAELLAAPVDRADLRLALDWATREQVPFRILGNGSNLLVRDEGVDGLVLRVRRALDDVRAEPPTIVAGAGALFPAVANLAASLGLAGLEFGAGIPGTIGGAIVMNAGWHEHEVGRSVREVEWLDRAGAEQVSPRDDCAFGYRSSSFRGAGRVVLAATFALEPDDPRQIRQRLQTFAASRKEQQPTDWPSCGSVFLKPPGDFAGRLIDQAGLKGLRVGDAEVSPRHANFFVNRGRATANDVLALVERVEEEVLERFGVRLEREFELW
jgi:UDP-N-acetylmuramate dehydrogenase